jgi:hypothetical protein
MLFSKPTSVKILAVPIMPPECLPEGRKFLVVEIDWTTIPVFPLAASSPYIQLPEVTITDNSGNGPGLDNSLDGYQAVEFSLQSLVNGSSLSQCVALLYHWRPSWGAEPFDTDQTPGDFAWGASVTSALFVSSVEQGQTVNVPCAGETDDWDDVQWIIDGCFPFFALSNGTIRMVRLCELAGGTVGSGRGTFIFSNFPIDPFCVRTIATGDNP